MSSTFNIISPRDNQVFTERTAATTAQIRQTLDNAAAAQRQWQQTPMQQRASILSDAINCFVMNKKELALELTHLIGRPIRHCGGEIAGLAERGRHMIDIAPQSLSDINLAKKPDNLRFIRRLPLGVVLTIAPWNYPYVTAVNSVLPALMAGNAVVLKHSPQTLPVAERFLQAFECANLPRHLFQFLHLDHQQTTAVVADPQVDFISFTGSVAGGKAVEQAAAGKFKRVALELGGKDPAYVRADADIARAARQLADGAFYNAGQSCCSIERIYVQQSVYQAFVNALVAQAQNYVLGDPLDEATTLGPMVSVKAAEMVRAQIRDAIKMGATAHINSADFAHDQRGTAYLAPQVLTEVNHQMSIMTEESFGPVVGIMPVADDDEAVALMNDSPFGLTASLWTRDQQAAIAIGNRIDTGTVFMNRCDYLDPGLCWSGVKQSGRGCALSSLGYDQLTRPKSFNLNK